MPQPVSTLLENGLKHAHDEAYETLSHVSAPPPLNSVVRGAGYALKAFRGLTSVYMVQ